jgi:hypothetical protein
MQSVPSAHIEHREHCHFAPASKGKRRRPRLPHALRTEAGGLRQLAFTAKPGGACGKPQPSAIAQGGQDTWQIVRGSRAGLRRMPHILRRPEQHAVGTLPNMQCERGAASAPLPPWRACCKTLRHTALQAAARRSTGDRYRVGTDAHCASARRGHTFFALACRSIRRRKDAKKPLGILRARKTKRRIG